MKSKILATGLLIGLMLGCNVTNQDTTATSTLESQQALKSKVTEISEGNDSPAQPKLSVGRAAKLNSEQIQKLVSLVGLSKDFKNQSVGVLPTYIPDGFKVTDFHVWRQEKVYTGGHYEIVYENNSGACFTIGGGVIMPIGDEPEHFEEIQNIHSPALGSVELGFTKSSRVNRSNLVAFAGSLDRIDRGKNEYRFASPVRFLMSNDINNEHWQSCNMMSLQDAKKVVQSLQFLQP